MQFSLFQIPRTTLPLIVVLFVAFAVSAQTSVFTYQGRLTDTNIPASGTHQMQFALYDAVTGGTQIGSTVENTAVNVSNGVFTVQLDYGAAAFSAVERFLEISVRRNSNETYTTLSPRQRITSAPYSIRALNAGTADNAASLGGTAASQFVQTTDSRLSDARTPTAGSANYIQNTTTQQTGADFNISGNGTVAGTLSANLVNSQTQYNIGGQRILSNAGTDNMFVGSLAGAANTGGGNSFFGKATGNGNTTGFNHVFVGERAGLLNTTGNSNSFFGSVAGLNNTIGSNNTIIGASANVGSNNRDYASAFGSGAVVNFNDTIVIGKVAGNYVVNGVSSMRPADMVQIPGNQRTIGLARAGSETGQARLRVFSAALTPVWSRAALTARVPLPERSSPAPTTLRSNVTARMADCALHTHSRHSRWGALCTVAE